MPLKYLSCELNITTVQKTYTEKFGDIDIPHTGIYNLDGISPRKKLCLLDLCKGNGFDAPDYGFCFRKAGFFIYEERMAD